MVTGLSGQSLPYFASIRKRSSSMGTTCLAVRLIYAGSVVTRLPTMLCKYASLVLFSQLRRARDSRFQEAGEEINKNCCFHYVNRKSHGKIQIVRITTCNDHLPDCLDAPENTLTKRLAHEQPVTCPTYDTQHGIHGRYSLPL
jgi:hypothetical protein